MTQQSIHAIKSAIDKATHVCLFGIGTLLDDCLDQLVWFLGREPDVLCDNNPEKWGMEFWGEKCISPWELGKLSSPTVVIVTVKSHEDLCLQLAGWELRMCSFPVTIGATTLSIVLNARKGIHRRHPIGYLWFLR